MLLKEQVVHLKNEGKKKRKVKEKEKIYKKNEILQYLLHVKQGKMFLFLCIFL